MNKIVCVLFLILSLSSYGQNVLIKGISPFLNKKISLFIHDDYISKKEVVLKDAYTNNEGIFEIPLISHEIQKVYIRCENYQSFMFIEPNRTYFIEFSNKLNTDYNKLNESEISFFNLDTLDINYKILSFEHLLDFAINRIYSLKESSPTDYFNEVIKFKDAINTIYTDDTSSFFLNYVKYAIALNIEDLNGKTGNTNYEKFLFYLKSEPINFKNDLYSTYFIRFYKDYFFNFSPEQRLDIIYQLDIENFERFVQILQNDSLIQQKNISTMAGLIIVKELYDKNLIEKPTFLYFLKYFIEQRESSEFKNVFENLFDKYNTMKNGSSVENFTFLKGLKNKYVYIHYYNPRNFQSRKEVEALKVLYKKYSPYIEFITIYLEVETLTKQDYFYLDKITWKKIELEKTDPFWDIMDVKQFPSYTLLEKNLIIKELHAKSPSPSGTYETIEKTFFQIKQKTDRDF